MLPTDSMLQVDSQMGSEVTFFNGNPAANTVTEQDAVSEEDDKADEDSG
jgi:hypothetical protein